MSSILEKWLTTTYRDKQSRTCGVSIKNGRFFMRLTQYFEHYNDGLDAKGEGDTLSTAAHDTILHLHQLLWKQILRRSADEKNNAPSKFTRTDPVLIEMRELQQKEFNRFKFLKEEKYREKIFKNDILELLKTKDDLS